jgi:hypothetical protein
VYISTNLTGPKVNDYISLQLPWYLWDLNWWLLENKSRSCTHGYQRAILEYRSDGEINVKRPIMRKWKSSDGIQIPPRRENVISIGRFRMSSGFCIVISEMNSFLVNLWNWNQIASFFLRVCLLCECRACVLFHFQYFYAFLDRLPQAISRNMYYF